MVLYVKVFLNVMDMLYYYMTNITLQADCLINGHVIWILIHIHLSNKLTSQKC